MNKVLINIKLIINEKYEGLFPSRIKHGQKRLSSLYFKNKNAALTD
jgi:hypothetical protein